MKKKIVIVLLVLCMGICFVPTMAFAANEVNIEIDETNFPDTNFRKYVKSNFDIDKDGVLSETEIEKVKNIYCSSRNINSLTGIEKFPYLQKLDCHANSLTSLDVSKNTELNYLYCRQNKLIALDISKNSALIYLDCSMNKIAVLEVDNNINLDELDCASNEISSLDVTKNLRLTYLACGMNNLKMLNISENTKLEELYCNSNALTLLDTSRNILLKNLDCRSNKLTTIDFSKNANLAYLAVSNNHLTSLDLGIIPSNLSGDAVEANSNTYEVTLSADNSFDLSTLPQRFDKSKASNWNGGSVSGNILTFDENSDTITYTYDCGKSKTVEFTLVAHRHVFSDWNPDENGTHTRICTLPDCDFSETEKCTGGTATTTERAICEICGQPYGELSKVAVISGSTGTSKAGKEISLSVYLNENPGLASMLLELDYDKDLLEFVDAENGDVFPSSSFMAPNADTDNVKVLSWQNSTLTDDIRTTGKLVTLTFKIKETAPAGETKIHFLCDDTKKQALNACGDSVKVISSDATVNIVEFYYGDVDDNDKVDSSDALYLRRYLARWKSYQNMNEKAADVDCDGAITLRDLTILERYIAGWAGYEILPVTTEQKGV